MIVIRPYSVCFLARSLVASCLLVGAAAAQSPGTPMYRFTSSATALDSIQDFDGDGVRELITCGPQTFQLSTPPQSCTGCGQAVVEMRSGANGSLIRSVTLGLTFAGGAIAALDDVNSDGYQDFVVTIVQPSLVGGPGNMVVDQSRALVINGFRFFNQSAGYTLANFGSGIAPQPAGSNNIMWGTTVAAIGDVDGRPGSEIAIGAPDFDNVPMVDVGLVDIRDWRSLYFNALVGSAAGERFGAAVSSLGPCNAGNPTDFIVGVPGVNVVRRFSLPATTPTDMWSGTGNYGTSLAATRGQWPILGTGNYFVAGAPGGAGLGDVRGTGATCGSQNFLVTGAPPVSNLGFSTSWVGNLFLAASSCSGVTTEDWIAVGAPDLGAGTGSYVLLASDPNCAVIAIPTPFNSPASSTFGYAVTELDDVDQDGFIDEFAVADPLARIVYVF